MKTLIDALIVGSVVGMILLFRRHRDATERLGVAAPLQVILGGVSFIALFCAADLITMFALPPILGRETAWAATRALHRTWSWAAAIGAVGAIGGGIYFLLRSAIPRALERLESADSGRQDSDERFRLFAEAATDGIIAIDENSVIGFANRATERILGYSVDELQGQPITTLMAQPLQKRHLDGIARVIQTGRPSGSWEGLEFTARHKDGRDVPIEVSISKMKQPDGTLRFAGFIRDITDRKRMEAERAQAESAWRSVVEGTARASGDALLRSLVRQLSTTLGFQYCFVAELIPDAPDRARTIAMWGKDQICENFEYDLAGTPCEEVINKQTCYYTKSVQQLYPKDWVLRELKIESYLGTPLRDSAGKPIGLLSIMHDEQCAHPPHAIELLTIFAARAAAELERQRSQQELDAIEQQLQQAVKMEAVGRLAGGIAHDFNNLLTVISGFSEVLLGDLQAGSPSHQSAHQIATAAKRGADLTRQLLTFSRADALEPKVLDLNHVIANTGEMLTRLAPESVAIELNLDPSIGPIRIDPHQIEQILLNLTVNACDAMPDGGQIEISTRSVELGPRETDVHPAVRGGHYTVLEVSDTGCGMDDTTQTRVFEPFFTTKDVGRGTGLGLSTSYAIAGQNSGGIRLRSQLGVGTTFEVFFPRHDEALESPAPSDTRIRAPDGSETVLVVEDEPMVRELMSISLKEWGYTVLEAASGAEALEIVRSGPQPIALLLTDVVMPEMSGIELEKQLRTLRPDIKVMFVSGYAGRALGQSEFPPHATFLRKPFELRELAAKIRDTLTQ